MAEEFQESDVVFSDQKHHRHNTRKEDVTGYFDYREMRGGRNNDNDNRIEKCGKKEKKMVMSSSLPVNIPRDGVFHYAAADADDFEEECNGGEEGGIVPPHVILGRRIAGKMAFSVCTGNGRTLKGRDLSQVRNRILRMTGFLET
ncbi:hypothetical protein SLEP1_g7828 [Rubroshorea leprosula]|uniref:Senescence regulator n=1 Tax=Rubroshorea leprosula TaxID=152421 RepID=A0AAV5IAL5_9ROSI|nr:hypothetical protein SLEP1_g7828 [Rubroshorea leprosula]